jgi:hypothetical protein
MDVQGQAVWSTRLCAKVRRGFCGQWDGGFNLDLHAVIEASEDHPHVVYRVWCVLLHRLIFGDFPPQSNPAGPSNAAAGSGVLFARSSTFVGYAPDFVTG